MKIASFGVEEWMNNYETLAKYNLGETCVSPLSLNELCHLNEIKRDDFIDGLMKLRLTYGEIIGNQQLRTEISKLYREIAPTEIVTTHGAIGANSLVLNTLVEPEDEVIVVTPTYQQLQSIPQSLGATVKLLPLLKENDYLPDLVQLEKMVTDKTKIIIINNPNNPTGALMDEGVLTNIVKIAQQNDSYVLCDEVYRHLTQKENYSVSITDLYTKGISTSSMSKVFSMAGLRLGWIATKSEDLMNKIKSRRDYQTISAGILDEHIAAIALQKAQNIIARNRKIIKKNLQIVDSWVNQTPGFSWVRPQAGTTGLIYYSMDMKSTTFADQLMKKTGVLVVPGDTFDIPKSFRIGYAFEQEKLNKGLELIRRFSESNGN